MDKRVCTVCGEEKLESMFHKNNKSRGGIDIRCAECKNRLQRERRAKPSEKEKARSYYTSDEYKRERARRRFENGGAFKLVQKHLDKLKNKERAGRRYVSKEEAVEYGLTRYFDGSICKRGHVSERVVANGMCCQCQTDRAQTKEHKKKKSEYYRKNKESLMAANVKAQRERYQKSPSYKAAAAARNMLKRVLRQGNKRKHGGTYEMLGYGRIDLMNRMEGQFQDGMSWDNYGEWHIDHITPVSWFVKNGITDPSVINALSNLQPLWAEENFAKGNRVDGVPSK